MHVEVKDPDDKEILSRVYSAEGNQQLCIYVYKRILTNFGIWLFRKIPIYFTHTGRTYHLFVLKHISMV